MSKIYAEFESFDLADFACRNLKSNVNGIQRISITDKRQPEPYAVNAITSFGQGVNTVQPYVTVISEMKHPHGSAASVNIICDPVSIAPIKKQLISKGGLSVKVLS